MSLSIGGAYGLTAPAYTKPQSGAPSGGASADNPAGDTAVAEFLNWAKMSPGQRMRAQLLAQMGLKEEDLKAMDPEKRKAIEEAIQQKIREAAMHAADKGQTGLVADVKV